MAILKQLDPNYKVDGECEGGDCSKIRQPEAQEESKDFQPPVGCAACEG